MKNEKIIKAALLSTVVIFSSCGTDNDIVECSVSSPENYVFSHDGTNTVSFGGQTIRLKMVDEILEKLEDETTTDVAILNEMFVMGQVLLMQHWMLVVSKLEVKLLDIKQQL